MDKPISVEFTQTPLDQAIENLRTLTNLPLVIDGKALDDEKISQVQPITVKPGTAVAAKNILAFTLEQAGLSYVVEHDLVKITTTKKSKGRLVTKVFSVADLVTPVPNFALPDYANFDKMLSKNALNSGNVVINNGPNNNMAVRQGGLGGGQSTQQPLPGTMATSPGIKSGGWQGGGGGTLTSNPLASSASITDANATKHEQLIKLITGMVRPYSWDGHGR